MCLDGLAGPSLDLRNAVRMKAIEPMRDRLDFYVDGKWDRPAKDLEHAMRLAARLRTGNVHLNGAGPDFGAPFGGYKQSGNGREQGERGFEEFLEVKAVLGCAA